MGPKMQKCEVIFLLQIWKKEDLIEVYEHYV